MPKALSGTRTGFLSRVSNSTFFWFLMMISTGGMQIMALVWKNRKDLQKGDFEWLGLAYTVILTAGLLVAIPHWTRTGDPTFLFWVLLFYMFAPVLFIFFFFLLISICAAISERAMLELHWEH